MDRVWPGWALGSQSLLKDQGQKGAGPWHHGPRIVFSSAPLPRELNPTALPTVSEPVSLNHPWSSRSF